jgi:hypothetical protein
MSQALYQAELYRCAGWRPYEGGGRLERQRSRAHPASNGRRPARPVHHPAEESGRLERQRRKTPGRFRGGACTLAGSLSMDERETEKSNLRARAPTRFPGGDHHLVMSSPTELEERAGFEPARALPDPCALAGRCCSR